MARLNEPPVSTDSLETLRKKLLRQNRDLAKSNNFRALRIRELENDCACMLSENLQLRSRILELEKEVENNEAQRIADHALAIKEKLESQLAEFSTLINGLGLEPPPKRHSSGSRKKTESRLSFSSARPSPSQRRLRDIARDIEELGHIQEDKSAPRNSMNPEQIQALRSMADSADSPELGPPPMSQFIDDDPIKIDSPSRSCLETMQEHSPQRVMEPPVTLPSPQKDLDTQRSPSLEKRKDIVPLREPNPPRLVLVDKTDSQPIKAGSKRKLSARDDVENVRPQRATDENQPFKAMNQKQSIREKAGGKTLKELANLRKEASGRPPSATGTRKPLAAKSTNDDITSPKKASKPAITDEIAAAKADLIKSKASQERSKAKIKNPPPIKLETAPAPEPVAPAISCRLSTPLTETALLSPSSPDPAPANDGGRGGTPPPTDINSQTESMRPSRRNRAAISYAEPNLRDKMRRPTKELFDAVAGEGKYARRSIHVDQPAPESTKVKREPSTGDSLKQVPQANTEPTQPTPDNVPASPCAGKGSLPKELPSSVTNDRRSRRMSALIREAEAEDEEFDESVDKSKNDSIEADTSDSGEVDVYEFRTSSPQTEKQALAEQKKKPAAARKASRRFSSNVQSDDYFAPKERGSRRKSMMV